jgi:hypothetical protein
MLLERNNETKREVHIEEQDGLLVVRKTVPTSELKKYIEQNKAEHNAIPQKQYKSALRKKNMWKAASIPLVVVEQWKKEGIDIFKEEDWSKVKARLNDPQYMFLRTSPGKI